MSLRLGIDIGTSGVRTAVLDGEAVVSMARAEHLPQDPQRIDAEKWWQAVVDCLEAQVATLRDLGCDPHDIRGIAVDGTSGSMVLTDAALNPVSPALMYNSKDFDAEAAEIARHAPDSHITRGSNSALARAMRLTRLAWEKPAHLMHQADFIAARLMGRGGLSDHNNALKTGFDPEAGEWPGWIARVFDTGLLPEVAAIGTPWHPLEPAAANELGLNRDAIVHAGTTDSIAAFLAAAPMETGIAVTSLGSTLAVKLMVPVRIDAPEIGLYSHKVGSGWLAGGASNTGGAVLAHFFPDDQIERLSAAIDAGNPTGLCYYPLLRPGERFPVNDPHLPPVLEPRPADDGRFLQAMLEGIARIEALCYAEIEARGGCAPHIIYSAGGGAKNPVFGEIRARALGMQPLAAEQDEAAVGAARLAGI